MPTPEYQETDAEIASIEQEAQESSRWQQTRHALGNIATALIVADKGVLLRNLSNIKPF